MLDHPEKVSCTVLVTYLRELKMTSHWQDQIRGSRFAVCHDVAILTEVVLMWQPMQYEYEHLYSFMELYDENYDCLSNPMFYAAWNSRRDVKACLILHIYLIFELKSRHFFAILSCQLCIANSWFWVIRDLATHLLTLSLTRDIDTLSNFYAELPAQRTSFHKFHSHLSSILIPDYNTLIHFVFAILSYYPIKQLLCLL